MLAAAVQTTAGPDAAANLANVVDAVHEAALLGAELVVLPEKWMSYGALDGQDALRRLAEPLDGPVATQLSALAAEHRIDLIAGSISELGPDGQLFNSSLHCSWTGELQAVYRKVHLFDADVAGRRYRESDYETAGNQLVLSTTTATSDPLRVGMAICFDLRFPELFRALAAAGAELLTLPSAFTETTTRDHWESLVRARAIENGCFIVAANQVGEHPDGARTGGRSMIVGPWGEVLATADDQSPQVIIAELDPQAVEAARTALPVIGARAPAVYGGHATTGLDEAPRGPAPRSV